MRRFEPAAPFAKGQRAEILGAFAQDVVEPHTGGIVAQHLLVRRFAIEALLELIERRDLAATHDQELAVERHIIGHRREDIGKGAADIVARTRIETPLTAARDKLHTDPVPFPFR